VSAGPVPVATLSEARMVLDRSNVARGLDVLPPFCVVLYCEGRGFIISELGLNLTGQRPLTMK
jgi:hypothetical protein